MEPYTKTPADYLDMVKRRKVYIIVIWLLVSVMSVAVAYKLPKVFRSTATLLIEAPIPTNLDAVTASQFTEEQIQSLYQRIMTADNILSMIDASDLYGDIKDGLTKYELADKFKSNTEVKLTPATVTSKTNSGKSEVAFDLSFSDKQPVKAQQIANKLAALFIEQNDKARTQGPIKAAEFLMAESEKLNGELQDIDHKIAQYKEQNNFMLPEQMAGSMAAIDRMENELRDTDSQIRATRERIAFLTAELARANQELPVNPDNKAAPQNKDDALRTLRAQYFHFLNIYYPAHPSIIRLKREIKALDPSFEVQPAEENLLEQLAEAKHELKALKETAVGNPPDIALHKEQISQLEQQIKKLSAVLQQEHGGATQAINPAYLGVEAQYKSAQSELESLVQKQGYLKEKLEKTQNILSQAPQLEIAYADLTRERDNAVRKYTQIKEKWLDARLLQTLEQQQQGQTLVILEQAALPTRPEKAIRKKLAIGGFFGGLIAGLGVAFLLELMDPGLRGYRAIKAATGLTPLVVVPYIETPTELQMRFVMEGKIRAIILWTGVVLILAAIAIGLFYLLSVPISIRGLTHGIIHNE